MEFVLNRPVNTLTPLNTFGGVAQPRPKGLLGIFHKALGTRLRDYLYLPATSPAQRLRPP